MEIGTSYIYEIDTKKTKEIKYFNGEHVSIEETNLFNLFKTSIKLIWTYLTQKNKTTSKELLSRIDATAKDIFDMHNQERAQFNLAPVEYEGFTNEKQTRPNYIG